ncbi:fumarylacetoacetase [Primorskyibacter sp. S187A]|uniref:fumarylacetoacetase n=1 Tax=Primorskyibacter sp. S187A TaxID=3415130 RepID=UPI003C7A7F29
MPLIRSWLESANDPEGGFPLNNLPYGVFSVGEGELRCGVAVGDRIFDMTGLEAAGILRADPAADVLDAPYWNDFMELGPEAWAAYRAALQEMLSAGAPEPVQNALITHSVPLRKARLHLPLRVAEFTDFYAAYHHAHNVGTMFRGPENALPPNWLHMPIGYNGRASSVVVSGTDIHRPHGQLKAPDDTQPRFAPSQRFDFELELGAIVGTAFQGPLTMQEAEDHIFGYVLLNDWSARDIQAWEYQPLGPFQSKATATTISPWIVPAAALAPFRTNAPARQTPLLPHLADTTAMHLNINVTAELNETEITRTNTAELYYSAPQQLVHHASSGCPMRTGDLLGSGTISGPTPESRGCLLERTWGGRDPITLNDGTTRTFLEDGDTLTLTAVAQGQSHKISFGTATGTLKPAAPLHLAP